MMYLFSTGVFLGTVPLSPSETESGKTLNIIKINIFVPNH